jgi:hypothetical protein
MDNGRSPRRSSVQMNRLSTQMSILLRAQAKKEVSRR